TSLPAGALRVAAGGVVAAGCGEAVVAAGAPDRGEAGEGFVRVGDATGGLMEPGCEGRPLSSDAGCSGFVGWRRKSPNAMMVTTIANAIIPGTRKCCLEDFSWAPAGACCCGKTCFG